MLVPRRCGYVLAILVFSLLAFPGAALPAKGTFTAEVPPGKWKAVRVKDLPAAAIVSVVAVTSGPIGVAFLDEADQRSFPSVRQALFQGHVEQKLSFSVTIPQAGNYYVLFDNREGAEARRITVTIEGKRGDRAVPRAEALEKFQSQLDQLAHELGRVFIFDRVPLQIKQCGIPQAFASEKGVILCTEYAGKLYETLGDQKKTRDALLFTVFHELAHVLLHQWKSPVYDHEEVADEFATATMILLGLKERVRAKAEYFAAQPAKAEALLKTFKDDRHPLSAQRARNILRWARDPRLVRKWQTVFVPHMQTPALEKLAKSPRPPFDRELIETELASRQGR
jgi:hypothetical protein